MTRDEAIKVFEKHLPRVGHASAVIDFYAEVGMLKLDEPKSGEAQFIDAMRIKGIWLTCANVRAALQDAGLKIVEK